MEYLFNSIIFVHVIAGSIGLASFWVPVFARKTKGVHTRFGKIFAYGMFLTGASAAVAALLTLADPLGTHPDVPSRYEMGLRAINGLMLLYLAAITFSSAFNGLRAAQLKTKFGGHREKTDIMLKITGFGLAVTVLIVGLKLNSMLMVGLSAIGLLGIPSDLVAIWRKPKTPREWMYQHMGAMLGTGIAAHTAFLVFGMGRFVDSSLSGEPLVWLAPTIIGVPAIFVWTKLKRREHARQMASQSARQSAAGNTPTNPVEATL